jgi:Domain of unknown function (DUF4157)
MTAAFHEGRFARSAAALFRADAFVLGRHVFLSRRGTLEIRTGTEEGREILAHELVHVEQYEERGVPRFLLRYFGEYLVARARGRSHRDAYRAIGFEREASRLASERCARRGAAAARGSKIG